MDNFCRNVSLAGASDSVLPLCKVWQSLRCIMVLEESRTSTIAGNKAITLLPAQDGLTITIYGCVKGYARTVLTLIQEQGVDLTWIPDWSQNENHRDLHHHHPFLPVLVL
jgi:hypothetical protein